MPNAYGLTDDDFDVDEEEDENEDEGVVKRCYDGDDEDDDCDEDEGNDDEGDDYVSPPPNRVTFRNERGDSLHVSNSDVWSHLLYSPPGIVFGVGLSYQADHVYDLSDWAIEREVDQIVDSEQASLFGKLCLMYLPILETRRLEAEEDTYVQPERVNDEKAVLDEDQIELVSDIGVFFRDGGKIRVLRGENV